MKPTPFLKNLLSSMRSMSLVTMTGMAMIQYAAATDYQYNSTTTNFSTGFTPTLASGASTTSDRLLFSGAVAYTATDDLTGITVNSVVFNNNVAAAPVVKATLARGAGNNLITLGGTNPTLNFGNIAHAGVVDNLDYAFSANGFITKSVGQTLPAANPIMNGAVALGANSVTLAMADTGGDALAELVMSGAITGSGALTLDNGNVTGAGSPGAATPSWGTVLISANNSSFTGPVNITKGRIVVNNDNALGSGLITVGGATNAGGVLALGGNIAAGGQNYGGLQGAATGFTLPNALLLGGETSGNYGQGILNNTGNNTISGVVTLNQDAVNIAVNNNSILTLSNSVVELPSFQRSIVKSGNGLLNLNNASFTGPGSAINNGALVFTGTAPTSGFITIGLNGAIGIGSVNNAFPTFDSLANSGIFNMGSPGTIALGANSSENIDLSTTFAGAGLGALPPGATYTGTLTYLPGALALGVGGGILTLPNTNALTGPTDLTIRGNVVLNGGNNYTGTTTLAAGSLTLGAAGAISTSGTIQFTGGSLVYTAANTTDYSARFSNAVDQKYTIDTNGQNVTYATPFASTGGGSLFNKRGAGSLTLAAGAHTAQVATIAAGTLVIPSGGSLTTVGNLVFNNANLTLNGTANSGGGEFQMGQGAGNTAVITVPTGGSLSAGNWMSVGRGGGTGTLNITGGTVTKTGGGSAFVGGRDGGVSTGTVNQSGGSFTVSAGQFWIGQNANDAAGRSTGTYNLSAGTATVNNWLAVGREGGIGTLNVSGGTFTKQGAEHTEVGGTTGAVGLVNVTGGTFTANNEFRLGLSAAGSGTLTVDLTGSVDVNAVRLAFQNNGVGVVNLNGGTLNATKVEKVAAGGTATFNFNGGVLKAKANEVAFLAGLNAANVNAGGAKIDSNGFNITIAQLLPGAGGLQKSGAGTLTLTGANTYTGNTSVTGGTLSLSNAYLADTSSVVIGTGAVLELTHAATDDVAGLTINGVVKAAGTYDSTTDPGFITGSGKIRVVGGGGPTGYDAFKANPANGLTAGVNDGPTQDPDGDGIANLLEFILGGLPNGSGASNTSILPTQTKTATDLVVTFRRTDASEGDVTLKVEWSSDLVTWGTPKEVTIGAASSGIVTIAEDTPTADRDTVTVTIPLSGNEVNGKLFARVRASRP